MGAWALLAVLAFQKMRWEIFFVSYCRIEGSGKSGELLLVLLVELIALDVGWQLHLVQRMPLSISIAIWRKNRAKIPAGLAKLREIFGVGSTRKQNGCAESWWAQPTLLGYAIE